jgi:hypothetical protein
MAHKTLAIIALLSLAGILFLVYLAMTFESPDGMRTVEIDRPVPRPAEPLPAVPRPDPAPSTEAVAQLPAPVTEPAPGQAPETAAPSAPVADETAGLPPLNDSDSFIFNQFAGIEMGASLLRLFTPEELIRRFVVFVDNVANDELPQLDYPLRPPRESMPVREIDQNLYVMEAQAYRRFDAMIDVLVDIDIEQALSIYRRVRPLMQMAYAELGYPDADFDAVLLRAIDVVLDAEALEGPHQLIEPTVMYEFAESRIESMSPISKQLMRLGPQNTERLRVRLRQYRERLTAGA